MWSEILTAVWCSAFVGLAVWLWTAQREWDKGFEACSEVHDALEVQRERERMEQRGVVDPRGRVPLLGWVAVVPGTKGEEPGESAGDAGSERVASRDEKAEREVSEAQVVELEEWFRTKEQHDDHTHE